MLIVVVITVIVVIMVIVVIQTQYKIVCEQDQEETWAGLLNQGSLPRGDTSTVLEG